MTTFSSLYEFTDVGMEAFRDAFEGRLDEAAVGMEDPAIATRIIGTRPFQPKEWQTAKDMAESIIEGFGAVSVPELLGRPGLWAWLAFALRDTVYPRMASGQRKLGEIHRWLPADLNDFQKGQRHLVRMPVLLLAQFGRDSDHLLCGAPAVPGEVREQLTSQQDMFHPTIQAAARMMYFDDATGKLRRGVGGKGGGSARRFARVRQQLDVTWDLFAISPEKFVEKLPAEFEKFRRLAGGSTGRDDRHSATPSEPAASPAS